MFAVNVTDPIVQDVFELSRNDELEVALTKHLELETRRDVELSEGLEETARALHSLKPTSYRFEFSEFQYNI